MTKDAKHEAMEGSRQASPKHTNSKHTNRPQKTDASRPDLESVRRMVRCMSLAQKIGQMVMCGWHGTELSAEIRELVRKHGIGGVILFSRNILSPGQVHRLCGELQALNVAQRGTASIPLLTAVDQEGGMVARITEGVTLMPGNMALGATGDEQVAYDTALMCARELRLLGINMNFAPCVDVNNNAANPVIGVRSFGSDPHLVSRMGSAAVRGYQEGGVAAAAKHFPGHGDTDTDSHLDLPKIAHGKQRMRKLELLPFRAAIQAGVDVIMTSHVVFPALDPERPSTLSPVVVRHLLREELGYDGVVTTDCMEMKAIADHYGTEAAAVQAVLAGADLILFSHTYERQAGTIRALLKAVEEGVLSEARIDCSVTRLLLLKQKRGLLHETIHKTSVREGAGSDPRSADQNDRWQQERFSALCRIHEHKVKAIRERSITLMKDDDQQVPLNPASVYVVMPDLGRQSEVEGPEGKFGQRETLGLYVGRYMSNVWERVVATDPTEQEISIVLRESRDAAQIVVGTYNAAFHSGQVRLVRALSQAGCRPIIVALRNPYDINAFPEIGTYLATYESRPSALETAAKVLVGRIRPKGRLPVDL